MRNCSAFLILSVFVAFFPGGDCFWGRPLELENRISESARALKNMMDAPDGSIPSDLLRRSRAVVIFPSVIKAGLGVGGHTAKGLFSGGILPPGNGDHPHSLLLLEAVSDGRWAFRLRIWFCW